MIARLDGGGRVSPVKNRDIVGLVFLTNRFVFSTLPRRLRVRVEAVKGFIRLTAAVVFFFGSTRPVMMLSTWDRNRAD